MAITFTGNKYTGTLTGVGTTTITDSSATFTVGDFAYNIPRMIWLFRGGVPIAFARSILASSSTVLVLDSPFVDYDGNVITQVSGDTYYVSLDYNDVATTGWAVSNNVVTVSDQVFLGTAGSYTSLFLHMEDVILNITGFTLSNPDNGLFIGLGGCVSYGNPLDVKGRITGNRVIFNNIDASANSGLACKNLAFSQVHFGTKIVNAVNNPGGTSAANFTPGFWQLFMNCEAVNCNFTSPAGGGAWTSRESFQRVINPISVVGHLYALNLRWSNGYVEGGAFSNSGLGLAPFGADADGTYEIGGAIGERLAVYTAKNTLFRANTPNTQTTNFTNLLCQDAFKYSISGLGPDYNTNGTLNFIFQEKYTGLENGSKICIKNTSGTPVFTETVGISGDTSPIDLTYQTRTFPTISTSSDTFNNPWTGAILGYKYQIIPLDIDVFDDDLAGRTVKNVDFGGVLAQSLDLNVTETTKATVDAYTELETTKKNYDAYKSELYDNFAGETNLYIGITGNQLDFDGGTGTAIVLDSTASNVRDYTGTTLTSKVSTYTGGATGTGTVTIQGASGLDGGTFDNSLGVIYSSSETTISNVNVPTTLDFTIAGTYTISGGTIANVTSSVSGVILNLTNGAVITANGSPANITINDVKSISITNIVANSRIRLYNVTTSTEITNEIVTGTTFTDTYNEGGDYTAGDTIRMTLTYANGTNAKKCYTVTTLTDSNGFSFLADQEEDAIYNANGLDGSLVSECSADFPNVEIDVNDGDGATTVQRIYAFFVAQQYTASGIQWCSGITAEDAVNYKINTSILDLRIQNVGTNAVVLVGGRLFRDDGATIFIAGNGPIQHDPDKAYLADAETINKNILNTQSLVISKNN